MIDKNTIELTNKLERQIYDAVRSYRFISDSGRRHCREEIKSKAIAFKEARSRKFSYSNYCLVRTGSYPWGKNGVRY